MRSAGFWATCAVLAQRAVEGAQRRRACARRSRRRVAASDSARGVAAQVARRRRRRGASRWRVAPERELAEVDAVGARASSRPCRGGAGRRRTAPARRARRALGCGLSSGRRGAVLHRHAHRSGRHPAPADRRRAWRAATGSAAGPGTAIQGIDRRHRRCGTRSCAGGAGRVHRHARASPLRPPCPASARAGWEEVPIEEIGPAARGAERSGDVDRRADRDLVVEVLDVRDVHPDAAVRGVASRSRRRRRCRGCRRRRRSPASAP